MYLKMSTGPLKIDMGAFLPARSHSEGRYAPVQCQTWTRIPEFEVFSLSTLRARAALAQIRVC